MVRQLQANGAICRTFVNGPLVGTRISKSIHHRKINQSPVVPVSSSCTSRTFTAYVRVTTNRSANSIAVEGNHRCGTALYVRP